MPFGARFGIGVELDSVATLPTISGAGSLAIGNLGGKLVVKDYAAVVDQLVYKFSTTNLKFQAGTNIFDTIQDINVVSSPRFAALNLNVNGFSNSELLLASVSRQIPSSYLTTNRDIAVFAASDQDATVSILATENENYALPTLNLVKSRGVVESPLTITNGDTIGALNFRAFNGTYTISHASVLAYVDGNVTGTSSPGRIELQTTTAGDVIPSTKVVVKNDGKVCIGNSIPTRLLDIVGNLRVRTVTEQTGHTRVLVIDEDGNVDYVLKTSFFTGSGTAGYIPKFTGTSALGDSPIFVYNGNIGIGTTVPDCPLTVIRETTGSIFAIDRYLSTSGGAAILCRKARGTLASPSLPYADDIVGGIFNQIWSGSAWINSSTIRGLCDGTPTSSSSPGKLVFQTTPSGSTTLADRMTIRQDGKVGIGTTTPSSLLHMHHASDAADFYISSARTTEGRIASFNLQGTQTGNYFRFVWRSYTQSSITSDEVIQTLYDAGNNAWRQIIRFRLENRYLFIGEDALLTRLHNQVYFNYLPLIDTDITPTDDKHLAPKKYVDGQDVNGNTAYGWGNHASAGYVVNPMTAKGDLIVGNTGGSPSRLAPVSTGAVKFLRQSNDEGFPVTSWENIHSSNLILTNTSRLIGAYSGTFGQEISLGTYLTMSGGVLDVNASLIAAGLAPKASVKVIATSNINLSSFSGSIDGVTITNGMHIIAAGQSTASQNGIYTYNSGSSSFARRTDADTWNEHIGAIVPVESGTVWGGSLWFCDAVSGGTLGTTSIGFSAWVFPSAITAGTGITKTGNEIALATAFRSQGSRYYLNVANGSSGWESDVLTIEGAKISYEKSSSHYLEVGEDEINISGLTTVYSDNPSLVKLNGTTFTPSSNSHIATKKYVDDQDANGNTAYGWGNHASQGYLTTETDPVFASWRDLSRSQYHVFAAPNNAAGAPSWRQLKYSDISEQPTIGDGSLTVASPQTGSTNTTVLLSLSGSYSANTTSNRTINAVVGPALNNIVIHMAGSSNLGLLRKTAADTYSNIALSSSTTTKYLNEDGVFRELVPTGVLLQGYQTISTDQTLSMAVSYTRLFTLTGNVNFTLDNRSSTNSVTLNLILSASGGDRTFSIVNASQSCWAEGIILSTLKSGKSYLISITTTGTGNTSLFINWVKLGT